jgi:hypothetical protein
LACLLWLPAPRPSPSCPSVARLHQPGNPATLHVERRGSSRRCGVCGVGTNRWLGGWSVGNLGRRRAKMPFHIEDGLRRFGASLLPCQPVGSFQCEPRQDDKPDLCVLARTWGEAPRPPGAACPAGGRAGTMHILIPGLHQVAGLPHCQRASKTCAQRATHPSRVGAPHAGKCHREWHFTPNDSAAAQGRALPPRTLLATLASPPTGTPRVTA